MIKIYTDGSCIHKANITGSAIGPGGYGIIILNNDVEVYKFSKGELSTTNNKMELSAVLEAFKTLTHNNIGRDEKIVIYSDSQYVINGINVWLKNWKARNYKDVKNTDLWKPLAEYLLHYKNHSGVWVKGHDGDHYNEIVNKMAQAEAYSLT